MRRMRSLWKDEEASALVEGAVLMPLLITFFSGVFVFSWYFYQQYLVVIGLHEAASYLARSADPCEVTSRAWKTDLERAKRVAISGGFNGGPVRVHGWTPDLVAIKCSKIDNPLGRNGLNTFRGESVYVVTVSTKFSPPLLKAFNVLNLRPLFISTSYSERAVQLR